MLHINKEILLASKDVQFCDKVNKQYISLCDGNHVLFLCYMSNILLFENKTFKDNN